ncbi:MAG TPA: quinone-dependent dihydroorotate dehydrogenase [Candidatus Acidoferrum sp.]|nr:quinone-dependent dihydroorotate dehydrogenase [Candidatus Acidoferrum sp.]
MLYALLRCLMFLLPAEVSHELGLNGLRWLHRCGLLGLLKPAVPELPVTAFGLRFVNPVGLAAGLDKNGDCIDALGALGFGFVEVGTITPKPQDGNAKPRLFRLVRERAIINRMGFNNKGVDHLVERLQQRTWRGIVGVNIGKNLTTKVEDAVNDYLTCLRKVYAYADYIVVNLSSPNTPGLRSLQFGEQLAALLATLQVERAALATQHGRDVPLLLKIAPDLTPEEVAGIAATVLQSGLSGVIATNTTLSRAGVEGSPSAGEAGGLSGAPLTTASTQVLQQLTTALGGALPVIGVGGVMQGADAAAKLQAGATLVQVYSGFIYRGPALIRDAVLALQALRGG